MSRLLFCIPLLSSVLLSAPAPEKAADKKTAFDKPTFEAYVRHLNVWGPQIKIEISDPKPAVIPGFSEVDIHASAGQASADVVFYVSKDGQKIIRGEVFDVKDNPFKSALDKLKTDLQPSFGTPGAPVVIVEFSDFECPMCKKEAEVLRSNLLSAYPKDVRLYFMDFPLEQLHPWAKAAAMMGRCIFRQNAAAFWDFHDWIFAHQDDIKPENVKDKVLEFAKSKNIDILQLSRCIENKDTESEVSKSQALGKDLSVNATPTLFVNGRQMVGSADWNTLRSVIDYELDYQKTAHNAGEDCGCEVKLPAPTLK